MSFADPTVGLHTMQPRSMTGQLIVELWSVDGAHADAARDALHARMVSLPGSTSAAGALADRIGTGTEMAGSPTAAVLEASRDFAWQG